MNEIREYLLDIIKFYNTSREVYSKVEVDVVLMKLKHLLTLFNLHQSLIETQQTPELKEGDTWLVKIGEHYELFEFNIADIKKEVISALKDNPLRKTRTQMWYKISDIEWVEKITKETE